MAIERIRLRSLRQKKKDSATRSMAADALIESFRTHGVAVVEFNEKSGSELATVRQSVWACAKDLHSAFDFSLRVLC